MLMYRGGLPESVAKLLAPEVLKLCDGGRLIAFKTTLGGAI